MITIEQVYRAMGTGFPEGARSHVGLVTIGGTPVVGPSVMKDGYSWAWNRRARAWQDCAMGRFNSLGGNIGPEPARPFVPVFNDPDFTETLERLEHVEHFMGTLSAKPDNTLQRLVGIASDLPDEAFEEPKDRYAEALEKARGHYEYLSGSLEEAQASTAFYRPETDPWERGIEALEEVFPELKEDCNG